MSRNVSPRTQDPSDTRSRLFVISTDQPSDRTNERMMDGRMDGWMDKVDLFVASDVLISESRTGSDSDISVSKRVGENVSDGGFRALIDGV